MEPHKSQPSTNQANFTGIGLIAGFLLGYPLSYFFQSGMLRGKLSLGGYIGNFFKVMGNEDLLPAVIMGFIVAIGVCGVAGYLIGKNLDQKK